MKISAKLMTMNANINKNDVHVACTTTLAMGLLIAKWKIQYIIILSSCLYRKLMIQHVFDCLLYTFDTLSNSEHLR